MPAYPVVTGPVAVEPTLVVAFHAVPTAGTLPPQPHPPPEALVRPVI
jgi:hypothetical protein